MAGRLEGKVALVTGGSRGIGAAVAKRLASEGATVAVNYARNESAAGEVVGAITSAGGRARAFGADVSTESGAEQLVADVVGELGALDIVVNNAGVFEMGPLQEVDREAVRRVFELNVFGVLSVTRAALAHLPDGTNGGPGGRVINISSVVGDGQAAGGSVYWASKAAVNSITRSLAEELGPRGITVNAVSPGITETDMTAGADEMIAQMVAQTPLGRAGRPEDMAGPVAFLASDDAGWVTGQVLHSSGGLRK
ncbi:MAG: SDR family NAD(P)-dependent oxidoreductase [Phycisphaerales bacterium JB054]